MLSDTISLPTGLCFPNGASHDTMLGPFRGRLKQAQKFVLAKDEVGKAAEFGISPPTMIVARLPGIRLRADPMWIEFAHADLRLAMRDMGSLNIKPPHGVVEVVQVGFLLQADRELLNIEYVHSDKTSQGAVLTDLAPVRVTFDFSYQELPQVPATKLDVSNVSGRVRGHLEQISNDPKEAAAATSLRNRLAFAPHPDLAPAAAFIKSFKGDDGLKQIEQNQANEAYRLFLGLCLPSLILLQDGMIAGDAKQ